MQIHEVVAEFLKRAEGAGFIVDELLTPLWGDDTTDIELPILTGGEACLL